MKKSEQLTMKLSRDILWIAFSIIVGLVVVQSDALTHFLISTEKNTILSSFISGFFFTSIFTIAPASIALAKISQFYSPFSIALVAGLGATLGDYIIFQCIRNSFTKDVGEYLAHTRSKRLKKIFSLKLVRWFRPILGAAVIISPLPDELGLALLGFSHIKTRLLLPLTFVLNVIGVWLLCLGAGALLS